MLFEDHHQAGVLLAEALRYELLAQPLLIGLGPEGLAVARVVGHHLGWPVHPFTASGPVPSVAGRTVVLVVHGLEDPAPVAPALQALQGQRPQAIIIATPVARRAAVQALQQAGYRVIALATPEPFTTITDYYRQPPATWPAAVPPASPPPA